MSNRHLSIELIGREHLRDGFDCGNAFLSRYLHRYARQNSTKGLSRAYVVREQADPTVLGYYTLSAGQIMFEESPPKLVRNLPRYPVPIARIGELAIDKHHQGAGLGGILLMDAFRRVCDASERIGILAIVVDAIDEKAELFYGHFGFESFGDAGRHLYLPLQDASAWLRSDYA